MSHQEIAKQAGISRTTLYAWLNQETFPQRQGMPRRQRLIDPFIDYLKQRWEQGCHQ